MTASAERTERPSRGLFRPRPALWRWVIRVGVVIGLTLWVVSAGLGGVKGAVAATVLSVGVAAAALISSGLGSWLMTDSLTGDVVRPPHGAFLRDLADRATRTRPREAATAVVLLTLTVLIAIATGLIGDKALLLLVGTVGLLGIIITVRNRSLMFMFVLAASFSLIWYKKFTPILAEHYAVAIYITTIDAVLLFAYFVWVAEGTFFADLKRGLRNPVFMLPVAGIAVALLSSVNALDQRIVWAEIVRYGWMTALFIYCGVRIRRREHIWAIVLGWMVFLSVQVIVATSQYFTHGFLGIEQFALKPDPMQPLSTQYVRPFGTQIHPTFLAVVVGTACLMIACFALHVPKDRMVRYFLLCCVPISAAIAIVSRSRGSIVSLLPAIVVVLVLALWKGLLSVRVIIVIGLLGLIGASAAAPQVTGYAKGMFGMGESDIADNWRVRWEINEVGFRMIGSHPFVGVGINSFVGHVKDYKRKTTTFKADPAHNIYILTTAETGFTGLAVLLLIGLTFARNAYLLTRAKDPFYQSIGIGALGVLVFVSLEGMNSFGMKQDVPLAMFWTIFGVVIAANRMMKEDVPELPSVRWFRPNGRGPGRVAEASDPREAADPADPSIAGGSRLVEAGS